MTRPMPAAEVDISADLVRLLPAACHDAFRAAYARVGGPLDDPLWARAKGWALRLGLVFLAHSADNPRLHEIGRRTVAAAGG